MQVKTEMVLPREAKLDASVLFNITEKIPPEKLEGFLEFLKGVDYGLSMAEGLCRPEPAPAQ